MRVVAFNLKLIKSSLVAASIAFVFGYALGAANWLKTRPSIEERPAKTERIELTTSVSPNSQDVETSTTPATSPPPVPAAAAPDALALEKPSTFQSASILPRVTVAAAPNAVALEEPSTFQTAPTPLPVSAAAAPIAAAAPEAMSLENGSSAAPPLPRADPRRVAQKLVGTGLPSGSFRRSTPEQLPGSRAPRRSPNPQRVRQ
jgi:cytoskeletal protein RodZ